MLIPFSESNAKKIIQRDRLMFLAKRFSWGNKIAGIWPYKNKHGLIEIFDVRFEDETGKKTVISFHYNGNKILSSGTPTVIYGREYLNVEKPRLIVEGAKCAQIAKKTLTDFTVHTWNGGSGRADKADWEIMGTDIIYILPDDDRQTYKNGPKKGQLIPEKEQPGLKAALKIKHELPQACIVIPPVEGRKLKPDGADIEQFLAVMSPQELTDYILLRDNHYKPKLEIPKRIEVPKEDYTEIKDIPFKILGVGDDGKSYYIDYHGRIFDMRLESITQNKLLRLGPYAFWHNYFQYEYKMTKQSWINATDWIISTSGKKDFDIEDIRGRGAWREKDGNIIYHDGQITTGNYDKSKLYLRKKQHDIGINDGQIDMKKITEIKKVIFDLSFDTKADAIRCIGWSTLAPFGGALPWRPAFLLTGESKAGKTTVIDYVIKKISSPNCFRGDLSSVAGVRGFLQSDSTPVIFDETDDDTEPKRVNRELLFSMMRASTSEDAPDIVKGTADQKYTSYKSKNMFGFASISTQVESDADLNRLCWIHLKKKHDRQEWLRIRDRLKKIMNEKNCRAIRALTWKKLPDIIELAEKAADCIQELTGFDNRFCMLEGILFSAYLIVWRNIMSMTDDAKKILENYISIQPPEQHRGDAEDMIERILDESVQAPTGKYTQRMQIREILYKIVSEKIDKGGDMGEENMSKTEVMEYKRTAGRYGLAVTSDGMLAVRCDYHEIIRIIRKGKGYHRQLKRHPGYVGTKNVSIIGTTHNCVLLKDVIDTIPI